MLNVFVIACFLGCYVVSRVTPALHSPLMSVTNAISSVVIIGGILASGVAESWLGSAAVILSAVNIVGGFVLTNRMLQMFAGKRKSAIEK